MTDLPPAFGPLMISDLPASERVDVVSVRRSDIAPDRRLCDDGGCLAARTCSRRCAAAPAPVPWSRSRTGNGQRWRRCPPLRLGRPPIAAASLARGRSLPENPLDLLTSSMRSSASRLCLLDDLERFPRKRLRGNRNAHDHALDALPKFGFNGTPVPGPAGILPTAALPLALDVLRAGITEDAGHAVHDLIPRPRQQLPDPAKRRHLPNPSPRRHRPRRGPLLHSA